MNARLNALDLVVSALRDSIGYSSDRQIERLLDERLIDWKTVAELTDGERIAPAFWVAIRNLGLADKLPCEVRETLWKVHLLNSLRNERFREQALSAIRILNSIGVTPLLLKGAVSLFDDTFGDSGARMMVDLDILVPPDRADDAWQTLQDAHYAPISIEFDYSEHHHLRPLHRIGDPGTVEVHRYPVPTRHSNTLPTDRVWRHCTFLSRSGAEFAVPAPTVRALHNILHSAVADRSYSRGELSLRSAYELALIHSNFGQAIDWMEIQQRLQINGHQAVFEAWLHLMARWFNVLPVSDKRPSLRSRIHLERMRLQTRWTWSAEVVNRLMWFSTESICNRYACEPQLLPVLKGRLDLALGMLCKSAREVTRPIARCSARSEES